MTTIVIILGIAAVVSNLFMFWYAKKVKSAETAAGSLDCDNHSDLQSRLRSEDADRLTATVTAELQNSVQEPNRSQNEQVAGSPNDANTSLS